MSDEHANSPRRPRGRPKKEIAPPQGPKLPVGRPQVPLRNDPDRYNVALFFALNTMGMSGRKAGLLVAGLMSGKFVEPDADFAERRDGKAFGLEKVRKPGAPATLEGRAVTIRKKARGPWDGDEAAWLNAMSMAFLVVLKEPSILSKHVVVWIAETVGEANFAAQVLIPMIETAIGQGQSLADLPPDFFDNFVSTTNEKI